MKKLNVLIVDDNLMGNMLLTLYLKNVSNKVFSAHTGIEAIEMFNENPDIDLILMDIQMPEMNGDVATKIIRETNKDVIIFAESAHLYNNEKKIMSDAGCNEYMLKPIDRYELMNLLNKYFEK